MRMPFFIVVACLLSGCAPALTLNHASPSMPDLQETRTDGLRLGADVGFPSVGLDFSKALGAKNCLAGRTQVENGAYYNEFSFLRVISPKAKKNTFAAGAYYGLGWHSLRDRKTYSYDLYDANDRYFRGRAHRLGVQLNMQWRLSKNWDFRSSVRFSHYNHDRFTPYLMDSKFWIKGSHCNRTAEPPSGYLVEYGSKLSKDLGKDWQLSALLTLRHNRHNACIRAVQLPYSINLGISKLWRKEQ